MEIIPIIVEPVVSFIVERTGDKLIQEAISLTGLQTQVERMETELRWIQAFLKAADLKQRGNERVMKNVVQDIRSVAYDTEDVIDTFLLKIEPMRRGGFIGFVKRCVFIVNELKVRCEITSKIKQIELKINDINRRSQTYGSGEGTSSAGQSLQEWSFTSPDFQEPDFVGFEEDFEALVTQLTKGERRRCVVSVVGMGGLGKTTLTKKLYNTDSVKKHFDTHAWISVSQVYAVKNLLQAVTKRCMVLSKEELELVEKMSIVELREKISKHLKGKTYLVVLDDIWTKQAWDDLKEAFPDEKKGSRVVLTTRNKDVALHADKQSQPHELRFLSNEESWQLFCKNTFPGQDRGCPRNFEVLAREIVGKCHCLPLAIVVIGGLLATKEEWEWGTVSKSIGGQFVEEEVKIAHVLSLSYRDLPYELKPCFLYLGNFPENYEFQTKELIQLWAAEGFLKQTGELTMEEVGEAYLMQLIRRSMVQVTRRSSIGGIKSCRIHDLLRDLSISQAKEGNFLKVHCGSMNAPEEGEFLEVHRGNVDAPTSTARRLAIHHSNLGCLSSSTPHLRSVFIYTQSNERLQREQETFLYRGFKLLRVLYLRRVGIENLPEEIGELIHLRYLGCTETFLETLPSSIGNLRNLQTLFVASFNNINVPSTIGKMKQLRHLQVKSIRKLTFFGWGVMEGHPRLDRVRNLQTLSHVKAGKWMKDCLGKLTNLRKLGIRLDTAADATVLYTSIAHLGCLRSLSVLTIKPSLELSVPSHSHLHKLRLVGKLDTLPESSAFPTNLTKLTLASSCLKQDPLPTLEKLQNLRILRLLWSSYEGNKMACTAQGFPQLQSLQLEGLNQLEDWSVEEGAMPSLSHLQINDCWRLKELPKGLRCVTTLTKLELWNMHPSYKTGLQENGGEDRQKILHISSIDITYRETH